MIDPPIGIVLGGKYFYLFKATTYLIKCNKNNTKYIRKCKAVMYDWINCSIYSHERKVHLYTKGLRWETLSCGGWSPSKWAESRGPFDWRFSDESRFFILRKKKKRNKGYSMWNQTKTLNSVFVIWNLKQNKVQYFSLTVIFSYSFMFLKYLIKNNLT